MHYHSVQTFILQLTCKCRNKPQKEIPTFITTINLSTVSPRDGFVRCRHTLTHIETHSTYSSKLICIPCGVFMTLTFAWCCQFIANDHDCWTSYKMSLGLVINNKSCPSSSSSSTRASSIEYSLDDKSVQC